MFHYTYTLKQVEANRHRYFRLNGACFTAYRRSIERLAQTDGRLSTEDLTSMLEDVQSTARHIKVPKCAEPLEYTLTFDSKTNKWILDMYF